VIEILQIIFTQIPAGPEFAGEQTPQLTIFLDTGKQNVVGELGLTYGSALLLQISDRDPFHRNQRFRLLPKNVHQAVGG
jgi:hypothetical protein